jgi:hypothetical protein
MSSGNGATCLEGDVGLCGCEAGEDDEATPSQRADRGPIVGERCNKSARDMKGKTFESLEDTVMTARSCVLAFSCASTRMWKTLKI